MSTATATATSTTRTGPSLLSSASGRTGPSLSEAAAGNGLIRMGQQGENVRELQQKLADAGYKVTADGKFGPETDRAVRDYQRANGLKVDGLVGPETGSHLLGLDYHGPSAPEANGGARYTAPRAPTEGQLRDRPAGTVKAGDLAAADRARTANRPAGAGETGGNTPVTLAPPGATEQEKYEHYSRIVRANGGTVCPNGEATVLGVRGMSRDGSTHETGSTRRYDDMFVVLTPDGRVREFSGATHPGQNRSTQSPDVTGDGQGDVGMINTGNFRVVPNGAHGGSSSWHVRTPEGSGRLAGVRDTNGDGRFTDGERAASAQRGDTLTGVLFHQGGTNAPRSIGCQTMDPDTYQQFVSAVGGPRASFNYTLVDANK